MLKEFSVIGFKNFRNRLTFSLGAPKNYDFNTDQIKGGIINKGVIYGKNGAGKSNLGEAIFDIENNLMALSANPFSNTFSSPFSGVYRNAYTNQEPEFSYTFKFGDDEVVYIYTKKDPNYVSAEKLIVNGKTLLDYDETRKKKLVCSIPNTKSLNFENRSKGISPLLFIYRTLRFDKKDPISKLFDFVKGMLWFRCLNRGNEFKGYKGQVEQIENRIITENKVKDFQKFLSDYAGLDYELSAIKTGKIDFSGKEEVLLVAKFGVNQYPLPALLSTGSQALELFYYWKMCFSDITFLFVDEFDAFYHYELSRKIIELLNKQKSFQSFVTTHNTSLMSNEINRPDTVFLMTDGKIKPVCDCTDRELREGHNLEKIYRNKGFEE